MSLPAGDLAGEPPRDGGSDTAALRTRFLGDHPFPLDPFQVDALDLLDAGRSVLVAAPTGSGKTLVAEYAIARALAEGGRAFYTTPLKALSNQKYGDLARTYGERRVGLLTGDVSLNGGADVVVMTTEVLRNMIYAGPQQLARLRCVVLDEVHYLEDRYRGAVWEEIILSAPPSVVLVCLSATVSNAEELAGWIHGVRGATGAVIEERRPVELRHLYLVGDRYSEELHLLPTFVDGTPNREAIALDERSHRVSRERGPARRPPPRAGRQRLYRPRRVEVVERLDDEDLLPAIFFVFSRQGCDDAARQCVEAGLRLTSIEERAHIREIAERHVERLSDADLAVLGFARFLVGLEAGIASHHAGMVPPFRETVEELFADALVRVVFATETLALGINMPARTVVIESLSKFSGNGHADLTPGEYTQLTGRAGRRGIDEVGYAAVLWSPFHTFGEVASLASARSRALRSSFRPTYNMAVNLVRRYSRDDAYRLVRSSFAQYLSEAPLTRQLDAVLGVLARRGYLSGWRVTTAGTRLAGIYHDCDLLVAEALSTGLLDGLDGPSLAALVSGFTFEARRASGAPTLPTGQLVQRFAQLDALAEELRAEERAAGLPRTRQLDGGFAALAYDWAKGSDLRRLLALPARGRRHDGPDVAQAMTGGDFVRNVKQLVDLLRQIGTVDSSGTAGTIARQVAEQLVRGVVAASSGVPTVALAGEAEVGDDPRGC
ncbi:MAG TPA: DEAD/DEAH box helicase [Acidimicrobiales bacterium]|nr:DEAD/DEAH box helicase [Acidimicrobiales bacterium]